MISSVNNANTAGALKLPEKTHVDTASASVFGTVFQQNTNHFATLETAQTIARLLGGTVVDLGEQWGGGSQTPQYGIRMGTSGPVLNAGLVAAQCQGCGVESGLSRALVEVGFITGAPISQAEALSRIQSNATPVVTISATAPPASSNSNSSAANSAASQSATQSSYVDGSITNISAAAPSSAIEQTPASERTAAAATAGAVPDGETQKLEDAAHQFEALMVEQMLKTVREESEGRRAGTEGDSSQCSAMDFAQSQLAQAIASQGGLGLAQMVLRAFRSQVPSQAEIVRHTSPS